MTSSGWPPSLWAKLLGRYLMCLVGLSQRLAGPSGLLAISQALDTIMRCSEREIPMITRRQPISRMLERSAGLVGLLLPLHPIPGSLGWIQLWKRWLESLYSNLDGSSRSTLSSGISRLMAAGIFIALALTVSYGQSSDDTATTGSRDSPNEISGEEEGASEVKKPDSKAAPKKAIRIPLEGDDRFTKNGVEYRKRWGFRAGAARLYPPLYSGWESGMEVKGLYEEYVAKGEAGYTLSSLFYNERYFRDTGSEFVNNFVLLWVPERYAFSLFDESAFEAFKNSIKESIIEARKEYADREKFESFDDYIAFKFGRDEEMEDFVDGYWIVADENDYRLTYFFTSEFIGTEKRSKQAFKRPLIATTSYMLVRNKVLKMDVVKEFDGRDDIQILLQFTANLHRDLELINRYEPSRERR